MIDVAHTPEGSHALVHNHTDSTAVTTFYFQRLDASAATIGTEIPLAIGVPMPAQRGLRLYGLSGDRFLVVIAYQASDTDIIELLIVDPAGASSIDIATKRRPALSCSATRTSMDAASVS